MPSATAMVRATHVAPVAPRTADRGGATTAPGRPARHHRISARTLGALVDKRWHVFLWGAGGLSSLWTVGAGLDGVALWLSLYLVPCAIVSAGSMALGGSLLALRKRAVRADVQALRDAGAPPEETHALDDGLSRARPDELPRLEARVDYLLERLAAGERVSVAPLVVAGAEPDDPGFFQGGLAELHRGGSVTSGLFGEADVREATVHRDVEALALRATTTGERVAVVTRLRAQLGDATEFSFRHEGEHVTVVHVSFAVGAQGHWRHTLEVRLDDDSRVALDRAFADAPRARALEVRLEVHVTGG